MLDFLFNDNSNNIPENMSKNVGNNISLTTRNSHKNEIYFDENLKTITFAPNESLYDRYIYINGIKWARINSLYPTKVSLPIGEYMISFKDDTTKDYAYGRIKHNLTDDIKIKIDFEFFKEIPKEKVYPEIKMPTYGIARVFFVKHNGFSNELSAKLIVEGKEYIISENQRHYFLELPEGEYVASLEQQCTEEEQFYRLEEYKDVPKKSVQRFTIKPFTEVYINFINGHS